jgi:stringent starvation protein B
MGDLDLEAMLRETLEARQDLAPLLAAPASRPPQPRKREVLERLLDTGMTQVRVDTTLPGLDVPEAFLGTAGLVLNFSPKFSTADLQLTDTELAQTLSFSGVQHRVRVPLRAIVAARSLVTEEPAEFQVFTGDDVVEGQDPPPQKAG